MTTTLLKPCRRINICFYIAEGVFIVKCFARLNVLIWVHLSACALFWNESLFCGYCAFKSCIRVKIIPSYVCNMCVIIFSPKKAHLSNVRRHHAPLFRNYTCFRFGQTSKDNCFSSVCRINFLFCCAKLEQHMFIDFQLIEQPPPPNNIV